METKIFGLAKPPVKVFKSIRVRAIYYDSASHSKNIIGHLNYLRLISNDYDYQKGDIFDERIVRIAKSCFIEADLFYNRLLILDDTLKECLSWTKGTLTQNVEIIISPEIPSSEISDLVGKNFKEYKLNLKLNSQTSGKNTGPYIDPRPLNYFLNIHIPYLQIDDLVKTIEKV